MEVSGSFISKVFCFVWSTSQWESIFDSKWTLAGTWLDESLGDISIDTLGQQTAKYNGFDFAFTLIIIVAAMKLITSANLYIKSESEYITQI